MSEGKTDAPRIEWLLTHGVERVLPSTDALKERLTKGGRLTIYNGVDPTGPTLHLGHLLTLKKLAEFQALGHKVILLIGDFTAMIGDPTDKTATRVQLTREEVLANCKRYKEQASRVLAFDGPNAAEMKFNSEWLATMSFADVIELASHFTVQQMLERDMFEKRVDEGKPIHLHEFFYPLMQGYDSVAMDVDVEVGGNDQTFNMLAGRTLLKEIKKKEKFVVATKLLTDPSGKKMGKTEGNMIAMTDSANDMYGKIMSWPDDMILPGFELCTDAPADEVKKIAKAMEGGENPMQFKRDLAQRVVTWLVGAAKAEQAAEHFTRVHSEGEKPKDIPTVRVMGVRRLSLQDAMVSAGLVTSKSEARRQIEQGGVKVNDQLATDEKMLVEIVPEGVLIQKGKRHFAKLVP